MIKELASSLFKAEESKVAINQISTDKSITVKDAYYIQLENINRALVDGRVISGKKIGLTSRPMQEMMGVDEPDYGHIFADTDFSNKEVPISKFIQPKVEAEIAFILKEDLVGDNITTQQVIDCTDYIVASIEIVDSRLKDWKIALVDTVADNASFGGYLLGSIKLDPKEIDLTKISMELFQNDVLINSGKGSDVLGNPATCVAWLANKMREYDITLKKGEVILSGALSAALVAQKGDIFKAVYSDLGEIICHFV